jgi:hypothetical protein
MKRFWLASGGGIVALSMWIGCSSSDSGTSTPATGGSAGNAGAATGGSGGSAGSTDDGGAGHAGIPIAGAAGSTGKCPSPIEGSGPFALTVSGSATVTSNTGSAQATLSAQLYFPQGRVAHAPVVLARRDGYVPDLKVWRGTLDEQAGATGLSVSDYCSNGVSGDLVPPNGGIAGTLSYDLTAPSDALSIAKGPVLLCRDGDAPAAALHASNTAFLPTGSAFYSMTTPVDSSTIHPLTPDWLPAGITVSEAQGRLSLTPAAGAFPPGEWALDLSSLRDVMGASYSVPATLVVLRPAKDIADPMLNTVTQEEVAIYSGSLLSTPGRLTVAGSYTDQGLGAVIGLGGSSAHHSVRVRQRFICMGSNTEYPSARVTVVGSDGASANIPCTCGSSAEDQNAALPGAAPWYLVVEELPPRLLPCWMPGPPVQGQWELEEFELGP